MDYILVNNKILLSSIPSSMVPIKISSVLEAVADDTSLELFKLIVQKDSTTQGLRSNLKITRKQYYSRLSKLVKCGLIKRKDNQYILTTLGRVMYNAQTTIEKAISDYWKIRAVDSLAIVDSIPEEEKNKLIETLIDNQEIKDILAK